MHFEPEHCYHIFNQGNNRELIFFNRENYFFFLKKIETHILPFADVLAYCLMPNHFHLMVYTSHQMTSQQIVPHQEKLSHQMTSQLTHQMTSSHQMSKGKQTFVQSIAIMLRSYTRAVNIQENRSGSLFKPHTKALCLTNNSTITPSFSDTIHGALINIPYPDKEYPKLCFNYIHNNPVKAGLVKNANEWEFSSYCDYYENRQSNIINHMRAKECGLI
ncbi:MAG TPA: hypothetical protein PKW80_03740 [Bacteroidales bacterium]|nr:hypothetical protein [Bacteroidales bacterium]